MQSKTADHYEQQSLESNSQIDHQQNLIDILQKSDNFGSKDPTNNDTINSLKNLIEQKYSIEDYQILDPIGQQNSCYRTLNKKNQQIYAIKIVDLSEMSQLLHDTIRHYTAQMIFKVHKNIVQYKNVILDGRKLYIVTKLIDGQSVQQLIQKRKAKNKMINEDKIWKVVIQVIQGLKYLHEQNMSHQNLKPSNILITKDGTIKLTGMNIYPPKVQMQVEKEYSLEYMPPEFIHERIYSKKGDIWQLGCIINQICNLKISLTQNLNAQKLVYLICQSHFDFIPTSYSLEIQMIYTLCLDKNLNQRPSAKKLLDNKMVKEKQEMFRSKYQDQFESIASVQDIKQHNLQINQQHKHENQQSDDLLGSIGSVGSVRLQNDPFQFLEDKKQKQNQFYLNLNLHRNGVPRKFQNERVKKQMDLYNQQIKEQKEQLKIDRNAHILPPMHQIQSNMYKQKLKKPPRIKEHQDHEFEHYIQNTGTVRNSQQVNIIENIKIRQNNSVKNNSSIILKNNININSNRNGNTNSNRMIVNPRPSIQIRKNLEVALVPKVKVEDQMEGCQVPGSYQLYIPSRKNNPGLDNQSVAELFRIQQKNSNRRKMLKRYYEKVQQNLEITLEQDIHIMLDTRRTQNEKMI